MDIKGMLNRRLSFEVGDELLDDYIIIATNIIMQRRYSQATIRPLTLPVEYEITCFQIALYLINRDGSEGQLSHNEGGIARTYANANIPEDLLVDVIPIAKVMV